MTVFIIAISAVAMAGAVLTALGSSGWVNDSKNGGGYAAANLAWAAALILMTVIVSQALPQIISVSRDLNRGVSVSATQP